MVRNVLGLAVHVCVYVCACVCVRAHVLCTVCHPSHCSGHCCLCRCGPWAPFLGCPTHREISRNSFYTLSRLGRSSQLAHSSWLSFVGTPQCVCDTAFALVVPPVEATFCRSLCPLLPHLVPMRDHSMVTFPVPLLAASVLPLVCSLMLCGQRTL